MYEKSRVQVSWESKSTPPELRPVMRALGEAYPTVEGGTKGITVRFERGAEPGVCRVARQGAAATVRYESPAMALRAVGALMANLVPDGGELEERSPFGTFGIMLDCSRNAVMRVEHLKKWLQRLALLGYNMVMLYTEDTYELPGEDYFGYLRGAYTAEELRAIDDYATQLGIEMVPCIQTLGHLEQIIKWPAYRDVTDTSRILLVDEDKTYALIEKMLAHWSKVYRSRRIHIGMDETHALGRGRYMDRFGYERGFDIFNKHLARVVKMCQDHGLKPMIWSDMYFRLGSKTGDYYDRDARIPGDVARKIPREVQLVYWDYHHSEKEFYLDWIARHRAMGFEPVMGSGVWTWSKVWYDRALTEANAGACVDACREVNLREMFFTLWGDDGAYCDFDSAFAGLAFVAEKAFAEEVVPEALAARYGAVCDGDYDANILAAELRGVLNPAAVLWDDPLLGIYLQHERSQQDDALAKAEERYQALATELEAHAVDRAAGDLNHARLLTLALAAKVGLAHRLFKAWTNKDTRALAQVREGIPDVEKALRKLSASFRAMWLAHNKPFGLEVIQVRFGGLFTRYEELARRLDEYLAHEVDTIPELEANTPYAPEGTPGGTAYYQLATGSCIL